MHCGSTVDVEAKCSFVLKKPVLTLVFAKNSVKCFTTVTRTNELSEEQHCPLVVKEIFYPI